jgi:hypothetical protein
VPAFTWNSRPLMVMEMRSGKDRLRARHALGQIRRRIDGGLSRK